MLEPTKTLSLVEQKRLQWAKEREEMIGLCGLWGRPKNYFDKGKENDQNSFCSRSNLLPPIAIKNNKGQEKVFKPEEESETSGYLSDSPKRSKNEECPQEYESLYADDIALNNDTARNEIQGNFWTDIDKTENYWAERKMYKNYKNENWIQRGDECKVQNSGLYRGNRNYWQGTPESVSSDDGCRLRWGDRGIGIGHLWDPVINTPDCRLPIVADHYRPAPKWVEKGLKNIDGTKSEVLIINHPDDVHNDYNPQRNFILGQNAPIPIEVIEERERKRKKALEHQNAIKKQLEERELKRKQERERRIREEKLEEERIKKEQEIERLRFEEEQRKIKEKEEQERKKEEVMKEAIKLAERKAREDKKRNKRHVLVEEQKIMPVNKDKFGKIEKIIQPTELNCSQRKHLKKHKKTDEERKDLTEKVLKDSSSQFEEIQLANSFQLLNVNGLPVDGGLALMLENTPKENGFILPTDSVQLALLMSPRNATTTNRLIPLSPTISDSINSEGRTLTPSKYRMIQHLRFSSSHKATQTDGLGRLSWLGSAGKRRKCSMKCGAKTGASTTSKLINSEKHHKHSRCFVPAKYRSKALATKMNIEDRPKWGINRPSVQYKKQSEKDPYYQKKLKEKLKNAAEAASSSDQTLKNDDETENLGEKELRSVVRLLEFPSSSITKPLDDDKTDIVLQNGFRMNSNLSSPVFVPIDNRIKPEWSFSKKFESDKAFESDGIQKMSEDEETTTETEQEKIPDSSPASFLNHLQLEAIQKIANLREGLKNLQKDYANSRSITPFSEKSFEQ